MPALATAGPGGFPIAGEHGRGKGSWMRKWIVGLSALALVLAGLTAATSADAAAVTAQVITVKASSYTTTYATVEAWQRTASGSYRRIAGPWTARVGYHGLATPGTKVEGDGQTPSGQFRISPAFGLAVNPGTRMSYFKVDTSDWWVGDTHSVYYNQHRRCAPGTCPFKESASEHLANYPSAYRYAAFIRYNYAPAVAGKGSAIFLHVSGTTPTAGCVSVSASRMAWLLTWMRPSTTTTSDPLISIGVGSKAYAPIPNRITS